MICILRKEPFNLSRADIGKLTPYEINRVLFLKCDEKGQPKRPEKCTFDEIWNRRFGKRLGMKPSGKQFRKSR